MKKAPMMIAAAAALLSATAVATTSSPSEYRGYQACLEANEGQFQGLVVERNYLIQDKDDSRTYYINGTAWDNGERVQVGISCETTRRGKLLNSQDVVKAHYAAASDSVQVAGN